MTDEHDPAKAERQEQQKEAEDVRERGTLTPEGKKQGVTSRIPGNETAEIYSPEENK